MLLPLETLNNVSKRNVPNNGLLAKRIQSASLLFKIVRRSVEPSNHVGKCALQERKTKQQQMLPSAQLLMTVSRPQPYRKLRLPLPSSLLRTASKSIAMIKLNHAEKTLLVLELFKTANMSAMITRLAGLTVLQRKEIPQQAHSGNASSTMIASTRSKP